ncbi:MAG TPA: hypothetical protein VM489_03710 [Burkholderiales bacterium]|nr:hypothetical protein [Burkholderiales bacterium]
MELLLRAASRIGSSQQLATLLNVPHEELRAWMRGEGEPPGPVVARVEKLLADRPARDGPAER